MSDKFRRGRAGTEKYFRKHKGFGTRRGVEKKRGMCYITPSPEGRERTSFGNHDK